MVCQNNAQDKKIQILVFPPMNCFVVGTNAENFIVNLVCFVELFSIFVAFCEEQ